MVPLRELLGTKYGSNRGTTYGSSGIITVHAKHGLYLPVGNSLAF
jgi:hypothetical protein